MVESSVFEASLGFMVEGFGALAYRATGSPATQFPKKRARGRRNRL